MNTKKAKQYLDLVHHFIVFIAQLHAKNIMESCHQFAHLWGFQSKFSLINIYAKVHTRSLHYTNFINKNFQKTKMQVKESLTLSTISLYSLLNYTRRISWSRATNLLTCGVSSWSFFCFVFQLVYSWVYYIGKSKWELDLKSFRKRRYFRNGSVMCRAVPSGGNWGDFSTPNFRPGS